MPDNATRIRRQLVALCDAMREHDGDAWDKRAEMIDGIDSAVILENILEGFAAVVDDTGYPCQLCAEILVPGYPTEALVCDACEAQLQADVDDLHAHERAHLYVVR